MALLQLFIFLRPCMLKQFGQNLHIIVDIACIKINFGGAQFGMSYFREEESVFVFCIVITYYI